MRQPKAFTLIELLIVVAIIAILAAIALPNFLEAQTRSKISCTMSDQRTLALSLEAYRIDFNDYPYYPDPAFASSHFMDSHLQETVNIWRGYTPFALTTPLAYLTTLPHDCFLYGKGYSENSAAAQSPEPWFQNPLGYYHYEHEKSPAIAGNWKQGAPEAVKFLLLGVGPDLYTLISSTGFHNNAHEFLQTRGGAAGHGAFYDPTNGTISRGDIVYHGPGVGYERSVLRDTGL